MSRFDTMDNGETVNGYVERVIASRPEEPPKKKRERKKKAAKEAQEEPPQATAKKGNQGRIASSLKAREVAWFLKPWIPKGMLSIVAGLPAVGKSTFLAWLLAQATRACVLPGYEEDVEVTTLPRLEANGADLGCIKFLDDKRYTLPRDERALIARLKEWGADILILDPIDSYLDDEMNENDGQAVRKFLESCASVAEKSKAAVVGVRHPGKDRTNVMPGSRQWRAVPRSIVELVNDGGYPAKYLVRHFKDSLGQDTRPREYHLVGERGKPRRFEFKAEVDRSLDELTKAADGPTGRAKVLEACKLIRHLFDVDEQPAVTDLVNQCRALGIGEHARDEARRLLGVTANPQSSGGKWVMYRTQKEWPAWLPASTEGVSPSGGAETAETGK